MRPHKLIMKAFGPFAKETTVDFDAMGNSIYLISGDTGSGKTTIFDGIIYALYGTASGGARSNLGTEAFHSDYAKDGKRREDMRVEFTFSNAGRTFTVERRMFWGKSGESQKANKEAVLLENGNILVSDSGKEEKGAVTAKVTEILSLDADQFRRIIMLAQGEFQKFLVAGSDERGVILGKLYDNRRHQDFQLRLKAADALLKKRDEALVGETKAQLGIFVIPEDTEEKVRNIIKTDHPELLNAMLEIIAQMEEKCGALKETIREKEELQKKLEEQKTRAETQNSLLADLEGKKEKRSELDGQKEQMDALQEKVVLSETAEKILPSETMMQQAKAEWMTILEKIQRLEEEAGRLEERAASLEKSLKEAEEKNNPKIEELQKKRSAFAGILHFYDDLAESMKTRTDREKDLETAKETAGQAQEAVRQKKARQDELEQELKRLAAAGELAVSTAKRAVDDLSGRKTELLDIQASIGVIQVLEEEAAELKEALAEAQKKELAAEERHLSLNKAFIQGQAGILADQMRKELENEESVVCPVCGTRHTGDDIAAFAGHREDVPTKEDVEAAYTAWNRARQTAKKAGEDHSKKENACRQQTETVCKKSEALIGVSDWNQLMGSTALPDAITACDEKLNAAKTTYDQAVADKQAKEKAQEEKTAIDEAVLSGTEAWQRAVEKQNEAEKAAAAARTSVENWEKQLEGYPESKAEAQEKVDSLGEEIRKLQQQIETEKKNHADCLQEKAANAGSIEAARSEKESRKHRKEETEKEFADRLSKGAFPDAAAYHLALSPEGEQLGSEALAEWIRQKKGVLTEYDQKHRELSAAICQLEESTKGMEHTDVSALADQIEEMTEQTKELHDRESSVSSAIRTNRSVHRELSRILEQRAGFRRASEKLTPLASAANGNYAFSRFVLSEFFHRIVEYANVHLETMTDGEYNLVPTETGDGRRNIGLGLKVLNTITNLERETATLSGGQLFEASLSLALGLSDVVQMESTSRIRIDSMFIDEGFGSLDGHKLDRAIEVLQHLSGGKRQIGIISHVARLEECLPKKIRVIAGERGSTVRIETDV